jgi:hypothetical protein
MWYRLAKKYNMFGLPISGDRKFSLFADEDVDEAQAAETPLELPEEELPEERDEQMGDQSGHLILLKLQWKILLVMIIFHLKIYKIT